MDSENHKFHWLDGVGVLFAMLAIFQLEMFFPGMDPRPMFIRTLIEILAFVPFAVVYRRRFDSKRWSVLFVRFACGLFALDLLWLFISQEPAARSAFSHFADWSGDWLPVFLALPFAIYSIAKTAIKGHRSSKV
jgi:hypothetical protein